MDNVIRSHEGYAKEDEKGRGAVRESLKLEENPCQAWKIAICILDGI